MNNVVCPSCGYCPTCGRSNELRFNPLYNPYPNWNPFYIQYTAPYVSVTAGSTSVVPGVNFHAT